MKTNYSPGEWHTGKSRSGKLIVYRLVVGIPEIIAIIEPTSTNGEMTANAALIAAAPALLRGFMDMDDFIRSAGVITITKGSLYHGVIEQGIKKATA